MNLANKLTMLRIILVPVFLLIISINKTQYGIWAATAVFVIAAITDTLDGYIARSRNQITTFGKLMDPLADKLIVTSALVALVEMQKLPAWVVMIIIAREFLITGLRAIAASEGIVIAASPIAKFKTISQIIAVIVTLLQIKYSYIFMTIAVIITIVSGVDYLYKNREVFKSR